MEDLATELLHLLFTLKMQQEPTEDLIAWYHTLTPGEQARVREWTAELSTQYSNPQPATTRALSGEAAPWHASI